MATKQFDVILFGASGFCGRQAIRYLFQLPADKVGRFAIAGRSREKLEELLVNAPYPVDIVIADSEDSASIDAMISKTKVLLNFAGPYAEHGEAVFKSCIKFETDYIDLTGETFWLREMIDKYHEQAKEKRVKLIPVCGYEAAPFDIATLMATKKMKQEFNEECTAVYAIATFITESPEVMRGRNFTAGTVGTTQVILESNNARAIKDPYYLDPELRPASALLETEGYDLVARFDSERG